MGAGDILPDDLGGAGLPQPTGKVPFAAGQVNDLLALQIADQLHPRANASRPAMRSRLFFGFLILLSHLPRVVVGRHADRLFENFPLGSIATTSKFDRSSRRYPSGVQSNDYLPLGFNFAKGLAV